MKRNTRRTLEPVRRRRSRRWILGLLTTLGMALASPADAASPGGSIEAYLTSQGSTSPSDQAETGGGESPVAAQSPSYRFQPPGDFPGPDGQRRSILGDLPSRQPSVVGGRFRLPPLIAATTATGEIGNGRVPEGFRGGEEQPVEPLPESAEERGFASLWTVREWAPPNTFSNPLYFEDRMLERHGHLRWGHFQPLAAGVRFFADAAMLPYNMTIHPPAECEYTLGYFRAGSCAPLMLQRPPYERRAAVVEAGVIAGSIIGLP